MAAPGKRVSLGLPSGEADHFGEHGGGTTTGVSETAAKSVTAWRPTPKAIARALLVYAALSWFARCQGGVEWLSTLTAIILTV